MNYGMHLGGYLTSQCPNGPRLHALAWYWSSSSASVVSIAGMPGPETQTEPCTDCNAEAQR